MDQLVSELSDYFSFGMNVVECMNVVERPYDVVVVDEVLRLQASLPIGVRLPRVVFDERDVVDKDNYVEVHLFGL